MTEITFKSFAKICLVAFVVCMVPAYIFGNLIEFLAVSNFLTNVLAIIVAFVLTWLLIQIVESKCFKIWVNK